MRKPNLEILLYTVLVIIAVLFRFIVLGSQPLDDHEASLALQSLHVSRGVDVHLSGEPGLIALNTVLFFMFRTSDLLARVLPALFGACLVLVPLLFRERVGRSSALIFSLFLAIDPLLVGVSRTADGATLAMLGLLAGIGFWLNRRWILSGIAFGAALLGGVHLWAGLIAMCIVWILFRKRISQLYQQETPAKPWLTIIAGAVSVLIVSTLFLIHPAGISALGAGVIDNIVSWGQASTQPLGGLMLGWALTQFPLIIVAVWGGLHAAFRKDQTVLPLAVWWVLGLALVVLNPSRTLNDFYWTSIPLILLAATGVKHIFNGLRFDQRTVTIAEAGLTLVLLGFSFLNTVNLLNSPYLAPEVYQNHLIGALLPLILLVAVSFLLAWGWSAAATRTGFILAIFAIIGVSQLSATAKTAAITSYPENNLFSSGYPVGASPMVITIKDLSKWSTGIDHRLDVQIAGLRMASLEWQLRDFDNLSVEEVIDPILSPSVVITPLSTEMAAAEAYRGQKFAWTIRPDIRSMKPMDWMKWSLFRVAPPNKTEIILWAKNELFPGSTQPQPIGE